MEELLQEVSVKSEGKTRISQLVTHILSNPSEAVPKIKQLKLLLNNKQFNQFPSLRKKIIQGLSQVFVDILPTYKIRVTTDKEKAQKQTAEVRKLRSAEELLLKSYEKYLELLTNIITGRRPKRDKKDSVDLPWTCADINVALLCVAQLYSNNPAFNFAEFLLQLLVPALNSDTPEVADVALKSLRTVFESDKQGDETLRICRQVCHFVHQREYENVSEHVFALFLSLDITEIDEATMDNEAGKEDAAGVRILKLKSSERKKALSRKERKDDKSTIKLRKALRELNITNSRARKLRMNTLILRALAELYINLLKREDLIASSSTLPLILEGINKYAKLLNVEYVSGIVHYLTQLATVQIQAPLVHRLQSVLTAVVLLIQARRAIPLHDPHQLYQLVYTWMLDSELASQWSQVLPSAYCRVTFQHAVAFRERLVQMRVSIVDTVWNSVREQVKLLQEKGNLKRKGMTDGESIPVSEEVSLSGSDTDTEWNHAHLLLACLEVMLVHRRRHIPQHRVLAFVKRIASFCLVQTTSVVQVILPFLWRLLQYFSQCEVLFDVDAEVGGDFDVNQVDPDLSRPASATMWELHELRLHHPNEEISLLASACIAWAQAEQGEEKLICPPFLSHIGVFSHNAHGKGTRDLDAEEENALAAGKFKRHWRNNQRPGSSGFRGRGGGVHKRGGRKGFHSLRGRR